MSMLKWGTFLLKLYWHAQPRYSLPTLAPIPWHMNKSSPVFGVNSHQDLVLFRWTHMQVETRTVVLKQQKWDTETSGYGSKWVQGGNLNRASSWKLGELLTLVLTPIASVVLDKVLNHSSSTFVFSLHFFSHTGLHKRLLCSGDTY